MKSMRNQKGGTSTVELGPAILILCVVVLIPCIDMVSIALQYACGWYCNHLAVREAACQGPLAAQTAANNATNAWKATGLGGFCKLTSAPTSTVLGSGGWSGQDIDGDGHGDFCKVQTTISIQPLFPIPFFMNQPITFQFVDSRPYEEKDKN